MVMKSLTGMVFVLLTSVITFTTSNPVSTPVEDKCFQKNTNSTGQDTPCDGNYFNTPCTCYFTCINSTTTILSGCDIGQNYSNENNQPVICNQTLRCQLNLTTMNNQTIDLTTASSLATFLISGNSSLASFPETTSVTDHSRSIETTNTSITSQQLNLNASSEFSTEPSTKLDATSILGGLSENNTISIQNNSEVATVDANIITELAMETSSEQPIGNNEISTISDMPTESSPLEATSPDVLTISVTIPIEVTAAETVTHSEETTLVYPFEISTEQTTGNNMNVSTGEMTTEPFTAKALSSIETAIQNATLEVSSQP